SLDDVRYLLILKSTNIKRGDIVSIQGHTPQYVGDHIFTKRVVGLPGDRIIQNKTHLTLKAQNGAFSITLPLLMQTKEGQTLTPLSLEIVPQGYFFVTGDHLRSFDSRYEEFGLVSMEKIYGKAVLKW
ncbi:MAG: signal peptidase I, partial [Caedimonadaceae bacterium]